MSSKLKIKRIFTEDAHFSRNLSYSGPKEDVDAKFDLNVLFNKHDDSKGAIRLSCEINTEKAEEAQYVLEVSMIGEFEVDGDTFDNFALNSVSILLPYLRAQISTITSNFGVEPVILPALNVFELLKENENEDEDKEI